ncbi:acyl-CoA dehydrogenase family protein [Vreelandella sp. EE27]
MIRDTQRLEQLLTDTRRWVKERAIPFEDQVAADDKVPEELVQEMREWGMFGWSIPEEFGGAGLTTEELILGALELSQCSVAFRARVGTNTGIGSEGIVADGTQEQKRRYLPLLASGELTGALAVTEPEAGSEATNIQTSARRDGDHYILRGTKCYITNAPIAGLFTVLARTDQNSKGHKGLSAFIVERDTPGLSTGSAYRKMGQAGSPVSEVHFEGCKVPAANLIGGEEGAGFKTIMKTLNKQRIHLAALSTGPAMRMLNETIAFISKREQFGQPIANFQLVQAMLAECRTEIFAARSMILDTARSRDQGEDIALEASMCKYYATEMCGRVADRCVQMFGGHGYIADHSSIERWYRDVRLFRLYEGTSQIHQLNIAKLTLKEAEAQSQ